MILQDLISEQVNPKVLSADFRAEKKLAIPNIGTVTLVATGKPNGVLPGVTIAVLNPEGKQVGYFRFHAHNLDTERNVFGIKKKSNPYLVAGNISVWDKYQRKGIATAAYRWLRELGNDIQPSTSQTTQGQKMWSGFDKKNSLAEGIDFTNAVNSIEKLIKQNNIEFKNYEELLKFVVSRKFLQPQRNDQQFINDVARSVLRRLHQTQLNEINAEDELSVSQRIQDYFTDRGYGYLGEGRDQIAFLSPRGTVVKVVGIGEDEREDIVKTYVGFFLRNQRNPHYPRIYNAGDFTVDGETYFVYEMEYLHPVSGEEQVLEYIEDLMGSINYSGQRGIDAFRKNRPLPPGLSEEQVDGLVFATQDLEDAIGGQAPLDLRSIENLGRRKDGQIVIIDPFSL